MVHQRHRRHKGGMTSVEQQRSSMQRSDPALGMVNGPLCWALLTERSTDSGRVAVQRRSDATRCCADWISQKAIRR